MKCLSLFSWQVVPLSLLEQGAVRVEEEEKENLELDEGDQSTHNIFNPEVNTSLFH